MLSFPARDYIIHKQYQGKLSLWHPGIAVGSAEGTQQFIIDNTMLLSQQSKIE